MVAPHYCEHGLKIIQCDECRKARQREYSRKHWATHGMETRREKDRARSTVRMQDPAFVEKNRARGRKYWDDLRHETIMAYGGYKCACCGETEPLFLEIDHVDNNGAEHRRSLGYEGNGKGAGGATWKWLKKNGFPPGFQILCSNCNKGKARNGGVCPHQTKNLQ